MIDIDIDDLNHDLRDGVDAALIYENEPEIDESLYWIIGNSYIRIRVATKIL